MGLLCGLGRSKKVISSRPFKTRAQIEVRSAALGVHEQSVHVGQIAVLFEGEFHRAANIRRPELCTRWNFLQQRGQRRRRTTRLLALIDERMQSRHRAQRRRGGTDKQDRPRVISNQTEPFVDGAPGAAVRFQLLRVGEFTAAEQQSAMAIGDEQQLP